MSYFYAYLGCTRNSANDLTVNVPGADIGDIVNLGIPASVVMPNSCFTAWVSAIDTVSVRFNNYGITNNVNPPADNFRIEVRKY